MKNYWLERRKDFTIREMVDGKVILFDKNCDENCVCDKRKLFYVDLSVLSQEKADSFIANIKKQFAAKKQFTPKNTD